MEDSPMKDKLPQNRTTPYDIQSVPRFPETLQIYRIPASTHWQCRYFIDGKYIRKSAKTADKAEAITFAKNLFDSVRLTDRLDEQKHPHTFAVAARKFLEHQASRVAVDDLASRAQVEDQKTLNKDILPYFRIMDVSQITKQTITDYLGSFTWSFCCLGVFSKSFDSCSLILAKIVYQVSGAGNGLFQSDPFKNVHQQNGTN
jgi:hypothetical protein